MGIRVDYIQIEVFPDDGNSTWRNLGIDQFIERRERGEKRRAPKAIPYGFFMAVMACRQRTRKTLTPLMKTQGRAAGTVAINYIETRAPRFIKNPEAQARSPEPQYRGWLPLGKGSFFRFF